MTELILAATPSFKLQLSTPGLVLLWDPLSLDRRSALVELLSPCCERSLYLPPRSRRKSDSREEPLYSICAACEAWLPLPISHLSLSFHQQGWALAREEEWDDVMMSLAHPFEATLQKVLVGDTIIKLMNRASAEYAWVPEGNSRGPKPLAEPLRQEIISKLLALGKTLEDVKVEWRAS